LISGVAVHEAGHCIVAFNLGLRIGKVSIISDGARGGFMEPLFNVMLKPSQIVDEILKNEHAFAAEKIAAAHNYEKMVKKHEDAVLDVLLAGWAAECSLSKEKAQRVMARGDYIINPFHPYKPPSALLFEERAGDDIRMHNEILISRKERVAEREKAEREKAEREKAEREKAEREKAEREKTDLISPYWVGPTVRRAGLPPLEPIRPSFLQQFRLKEELPFLQKSRLKEEPPFRPWETKRLLLPSETKKPAEDNSLYHIAHARMTEVQATHFGNKIQKAALIRLAKEIDSKKELCATYLNDFMTKKPKKLWLC
jgi:hypothetical protein